MDETVSHERESGFMSFVLGIPASADAAERRTPIVPDVATKLRALGASLLIQRGATAKAHITEHDLGEVTFVDTTEEVMAGSDVVWTIGPPSPETVAALRPGTVLIGTLAPFADPDRVRALATGGAGDKKLGGFARERGGFLLDVKRWLLRHEGISAA